MPYNPTTIANYFIKKYATNGNLTPMKLIKLTYLSYGWYLVFNNNLKALTDESPSAWDYGPGFPSLFESLIGSTSKIIKKKLQNAINDDKISNEDQNFLDKMWRVYGRYDGTYLSGLTLADGSPWKNVYREGLVYPISDEEIYQYYKKQLKLAS